MDTILSPILPIVFLFFIFLSIGIYLSFYLFAFLGVIMILIGIGYKTETFQVDIMSHCSNDPCCDMDYEEEDYLPDDGEFCNKGILFRRW